MTRVTFRRKRDGLMSLAALALEEGRLSLSCVGDSVLAAPSARPRAPQMLAPIHEVQGTKVGVQTGKSPCASFHPTSFCPTGFRPIHFVKSY